MKRKNTNHGGSKAQSEIFGVVLLLAMSMLMIGMIFVFGQPSVANANEILSSERSNNEFSLLDARIATTALGASQIQDFTLNIDEGDLTADPDGATLTITQNYSDGGYENRTLFTGEIGNIRHEKPNGEIIAYEGGGIWRKNKGDDESVMVSGPEFHYEGQTLTLPLFNITSDLSTTGELNTIQVNASQDPLVRYPMSKDDHEELATDSDPPEAFGTVHDPGRDDVENRDNPLSNGSVFVTVESEFYRGWQDYFEQRSDGEVTDVDDSENEVKMELTVPVDPTDIDSGGIFENGCNVKGAASCDDTFDGDYKVGGTIPDADGYVETVMDEAESSGTVWDGSCGDCDESLYYADEDTGTLTIDGQEFDVEDNTVTVALDGDATINEVDINVDDDNSYRLEIVTTGDIEFNSGGRNTDSGNSTRMIIYSGSGNEINFRGNQGADSYGVLYAPGSDVEFRGAPNWKWRGSIVAQTFTNRGNPGTIEHGQDMEINTQLIEDPITFLHVTENRVRVR